MKRSLDDGNESALRYELSRSVKENHGGKILKISVPSIGSSFRNIVAVLSSGQVNIYDTDALAQGHCDLIAHYSSLPAGVSFQGGMEWMKVFQAILFQCYFIDCCWLKNESDGYLALLLSTGVVELLSLSYSAIISSITCPSSIKLTSKSCGS